MMALDSPVQRLSQLWQLFAQAPQGQICEHLGIRCPSHQSIEHRLTAFAQHITDHRRQLHIGCFEHFLHTINLLSPFLDQGLGIPGQVTQFTKRSGRNKAGAKQTVLQQIGDPFGVFDVRLAAWNGFQMLSIHQKHLQMAFQHVKDGFPVACRAFHSDMGDSQGFKPITQQQQVRCHRAKRSPFLAPLALGTGNDGTDDHISLMHIKSCTALIHEIHRVPPL